ncbi:hypothetical protein BHM03_00045462, partial [Ensete ventricosum]
PPSLTLTVSSSPLRRRLLLLSVDSLSVKGRVLLPLRLAPRPRPAPPYGRSYERSPLQATTSACRRPAYGRHACRHCPYGWLPLQPSCGLIPPSAAPIAS